MKNRKRNGKYIDPTTDYGFKRIFGEDVGKDLLIAFLNELLKGRKTIKNLTYRPAEKVGSTKDKQTVIFDLFCTADDGERFVIEMQGGLHANLKERMVYYGTRLVADQENDGEGPWIYDLSEVYVIVLMDGFRMPDKRDSAEYIHEECICDKRTGKPGYEGLEFIYIELVKFAKKEHELETDLDRWFYVLKNMSEMDDLPKYLRKPIFEKLFKIAEYAKMNREEKKMYDTSLKMKRDQVGLMEGARLMGMEQGMEQGVKRGMEQGVKQGMEQGVKRGAETAKFSIALNLKTMGMAATDIANAVGLSVDEVIRLERQA